jgi:hypothetical protein
MNEYTELVSKVGEVKPRTPLVKASTAETNLFDAIVSLQRGISHLEQCLLDRFTVHTFVTRACKGVHKRRLDASSNL